MISIIAAISNNNCIGQNGRIPWNISEDMKRVRELTTNKIVVMGRKTWESIPEKFRPLPNRKNVVITNNQKYSVPPNVEVYATIKEAIDNHKNEEIFGFGGAGIYKEMINMADTLYITRVDQKIDGCDAFFPEIDPNLWEQEKREDHQGFAFLTYKRKICL